MSPREAEFAKYGIIYDRFIYRGDFLCVIYQRQIYFAFIITTNYLELTHIFYKRNETYSFICTLS